MATAFPPTRHHTSTRIPSTTALSLLQTYLTSSLTSPHLHPDSLLTERGPQLSGSSEEGGLVLHHLRRVEAGLRGERLGDVDLEGVGANAPEEAAHEDVQRAPSEAVVATGETEGEWQDMESYQRQQAIEAGELGERGAGGVVDGGEVPMVRPTGGPAVTREDKEERKRKKKMRAKEETRKREERRKREREMEMAG